VPDFESTFGLFLGDHQSQYLYVGLGIQRGAMENQVAATVFAVAGAVSPFGLALEEEGKG
jgi:hypothetical protein